jgi:AraC family transcriptional regulator
MPNPHHNETDAEDGLLAVGAISGPQLKPKEGKMEPRIVELAGFTVVGLRYHGKNENNEIPQMWAAFHPRIGEIKNMVTDRTAYGISASMDPATGEFDYIAGFEVSRADDVPSGMVHFEVPGGRHAVFTTTLPRIGETFRHAYETWMPAAGYRPTGGPEFELYREGFDSADASAEFELYIPVM